ncbi:hypothetical protein [Longispora urticae]
MYFDPPTLSANHENSIVVTGDLLAPLTADARAYFFLAGDGIKGNYGTGYSGAPSPAGPNTTTITIYLPPEFSTIPAGTAAKFQLAVTDGPDTVYCISANLRFE